MKKNAYFLFVINLIIRTKIQKWEEISFAALHWHIKCGIKKVHVCFVTELYRGIEIRTPARLNTSLVNEMEVVFFIMFDI